MDVVMRLSLFFCLLCSIPLVKSGCYQKQLCCKGKNNTCKAVDDGIDHLPRKPSNFYYTHRERTRHDSSPAPFTAYHTPYYEASGDGYDMIYPSVYEETEHSRIGKLVLPDVIELEGSGAEDIYGKYGPPDPNAPANLLKAAASTTPAPRLIHLLFGMPEGPETPPEDIRKYKDDNPKKHLLIRYSVLSQHLPLTVTSTPEEEEYGENGSRLRIQYLESAASECYCDESCVRLGDCCSDYTFVCPPRDCEVSLWSAWSACKADKGNCGLGEQDRVRVVTEDAQHGGGACPPLKEMRTCNKVCPRRADDITTVALLLDYRYNSSRSKKSRDNVYWDLPDVRKKVDSATYYCVTYEIGWVNRNCLNKQIKNRLYKGNRICAECQPEAQFHRNNGRCASDLEDGDEGFWKLIGPKSCTGIWRRIERTENCRCSIDLEKQDPFLLV